MLVKWILSSLCLRRNLISVSITSNTFSDVCYQLIGIKDLHWSVSIVWHKIISYFRIMYFICKKQIKCLWQAKVLRFSFIRHFILWKTKFSWHGYFLSETGITYRIYKIFFLLTICLTNFFPYYCIFIPHVEMLEANVIACYGDKTWFLFIKSQSI